MAKPLLHLCNISLMREGVGGGRVSAMHRYMQSASPGHCYVQLDVRVCPTSSPKFPVAIEK